MGLFSIWALQSCVSPEDPNISNDEQDVAPPAPTNLTVTNVAGGFTTRQDLNWTPSAGAAKYVIYRGTAGPGSETTYTSCCTGGPPFVAIHLTAGTNYCWQVRAANSIGQLSPPSNEVCLTSLATPVVPPPDPVTAQAGSSTRINVSWTAVTDATSYKINRSVSGGAYSLIASVSAPAISYANLSLTAGTNYCYTVEAVTNYGTSLPSQPACDTTFLNDLEAFWRLDEQTGTTGADSSTFGRSVTLGGDAAFSTAKPQAPIDPPLGNIEPHLDTGTTGDAATAAGIGAFRLTSAFSLSAWVYAPTGGSFQIMGMRSGTCGLGNGWELSQTGSGLQFIGQSTTRSFGQSVPTATWTQVAVTFASGTMRLYVNGVQVASGSYAAANSLSGALDLGHVAGCAGAQISLDQVQVYSRALTAAEVAVLGTRPQAPTSLAYTKNCSTAQAFAWTSPAAGADRWVILRGVGPTGPGNEVHYTHAFNPPASFNASHLTALTQYAWEVETVQNHLISVPSNEIVATTPDLPVAPTTVMATPNSQTRVTVSWSAVTAATQYYVYMSSTGSTGTYSLVGHVNAPTVSFQVSGLTANTTYWFEVQSEDQCFSKGPMSTPVSATTLM